MLHPNGTQKQSHHGGEEKQGLGGRTEAELIDPISVCRKSNGDWGGADGGGLERDREEGGEEWGDCTDTNLDVRKEYEGEEVVAVGGWER